MEENVQPRQAEGPTTGLSHIGMQVAVTMAVFLFLTTVITALRLAVVRQRQRSLQASDYLVFGSLIFYYSYAITTYLVLTIGHLGYPARIVEPWRLTFLFKCLYYVQISYAVGLTFIKCSILVLVKNIFGLASAVFRRACWAMITLCICWGIMTILISFLQCRPVDYNWNLKDPSGHCDNQNAAFAAVAAVDIATDVLIISLPIPMILARQLPNSTKASLIVVFALGVFTIGITIVRMIAVLNIDFATFVTTGDMVFIWSLVEWGVALIIASTPLLRPLVENIIRGRNPFRDTSHRSVPSDSKGHPLSSVTNASVARNNAFRGGDGRSPARVVVGGRLLLQDEGNEQSGDERFAAEAYSYEATNRSTYSNEVPYDGQVMPTELDGGRTWAIEHDIGHHASPSVPPANGKQIRIFTEVKVER